MKVICKVVGIVLFVWLVFGIILLIISVCDFLFFRIENEYVISLLILYAISCVVGISGSNFPVGFATALIIFIITLMLNRLNLMGGGDVKLLFPMILFSENNLFAFLSGISIGGLFLAAVYLIFSRRIFFIRRKIVCSLYLLSKKQNKSRLLRLFLLPLSRIDKRIVALKRYKFGAMKQEIPYGVAISYGGFCVILENWVARW